MTELARENKLHYESYPQNIYAIDTYYGRPRMDASHLLGNAEAAAFIDVGTEHSVPYLLATLDALQISRQAVEAVIVTHIHLDHAGGAGKLLHYLPNAKLYVHPRGARHLISPEKLWESATLVYGAEEMTRMYGSIHSIPAERVVEVEDKKEFTLAGKKLHFFHTEGHAKHHFSIFDSQAQAVFTGDTFGLSYREFQSSKGAFVFPTTTPIHFEPDDMHLSIEKIMSYHPEACYLTHFSRIENLRLVADALHAHIDAYCEFTRLSFQNSDPEPKLRKHLMNYLLEALKTHGTPLSVKEQIRLLEKDVELNAQGLSYWYRLA